MMKKIFVLFLVWAALGLALCAQAAELSRHPLPDADATAVFPADYAVVTPDTVQNFMSHFTWDAPEDAKRELLDAGILAIAFSPEDDVTFRLIVSDGDETAQVYHDIERYTPAMRAEIRGFFLNRSNFAETMRYTEAEWTNRVGIGRMLRLSYTVREGEEVTARGRQAYTIRGGMAFTLDMRVEGRRIAEADEKLFEQIVSETVFPRDDEMPLLPVGLTLSEPLPEEVYTDTLTVRGETTKGASIVAYCQPNEGAAVPIGKAQANGSGLFRLDMKLPATGDNRVYILAALNGFADSEAAAWVNYDPGRLPVSFTASPQGEFLEEKVIISGRTIAGVSIQCMEGDVNRRTRTGSDGKFSFTMDPAATGPRKITLSFSKDGFANRRFTFEFTRGFRMDSLVKKLAKQAQSLSYQHLTEDAQKYTGRIVCYSGLVLDVSASEGVTYVDLASKRDSAGNWGSRVIASSEAEVSLEAGDLVDLYFEVTPETYAYPDDSSEADGQIITLPAVKLLAYQQK